MKGVPAEAFKKQFLVLLPVYLNTLLIGCSTGWTSNAIYYLKKGEEISATSQQCAVVATSSEAGRLLMAIPAGILVDKYGRKTTICWSGIVHFFCWIALSTSRSLHIVYLARFFLGVAMAMVNTTAMISVCELSSAEIRGKLSGYYSIFMVGGSLLQSLISVVFSSYFMISYVTLGIASLNFLFLYWVVETPQFLISVSKNKEAEENLRYVRCGYTEAEITFEYEKITNYIRDEQKRKREVSWLKFLQSRVIREPLITVVLVNFLALAIGRMVVLYYITVLIPPNDLISVQYCPLVNSVLQLVVTLIVPFYIERIARRKLFLFAAALIGILNGSIALAKYCFLVFGDSFSKYTLVINFLSYGIVVGGSLAPMVSIMKAEILPQAVKGFGGSLAAVAQVMANIVTIQFYQIVTNTYGDHFVFLVFSVDCVLLFFFIYHRLPEARGVLLSDIQIFTNEKYNKSNKSLPQD